MIKTLLFLLLCCPFTNTIAQIFVRGTITDSHGKPIENASIYFNNTQIGTKSNELGNFTLYAAQSQTEIVVSCIGYETLKIDHLVQGAKYRITLREFQNTLNEVVIGQKVKNRAKWDAIFFRLLMGNDTHSYYKSKILNPEVISYYYNGLDKKLTVVNSSPIEITHPALGYTLKLDLIKFEFDMLNEQLLRESTVFYEDRHKRADEETIQIAVNNSYYGSRRHFYAALAQGNLKEEGFEVFQYHAIKNVAKEKAVQRINQLKLKKVLSGFQGTNIQLGSLIKGSDSLAYYQKMMFAKDYVSRTLDPLAINDVVSKQDSLGFATLLFKDTILVKYNFDLKKNYLHTKVEPSQPNRFSKETMLIVIDPNETTKINASGLSTGNNVLAVGDMALKGLSQELPKDIDPTLPRFKAKSALLRDP